MSTPPDDKRETISRVMDSAASTFRDRAEDLPGGEKVASAANAAAEAMEGAAEYVRESDLKDMWADMRRIVKEHPGAALLAVAAAAFLVARAITSDEARR